MMNRCSQVARLPARRVGEKGGPFTIRGSRDEDRLLNVVSIENGTIDGLGSLVYDAVLEWTTDRAGSYSLYDVIAENAKMILRKYDTPATAPKSVQSDVRRALITAGWIHKSVRTGAGPRKRWVPPATQTRLPGLIGAIGRRRA